MFIKSLKLTNFRSYRSLNLEFKKNTILVGKNAEGKTNLLEAIYLSSVGKSFRGKEKDMVLWEEDFFRVEVEAKNQRPLKIEYIYEQNVGRGRKTIKINGVKEASSKLLGGLKTVFFSPDEIDMFFNFPVERRRHFNIFISQINNEYARTLVKYSRILDQRNALLKSLSERRGKEEDLEVWDGKLAEQGAKIILSRLQTVEKINNYLSNNYSKIADKKNELLLNYIPSFDLNDKKNEEEIWALFLSSLLKSRKQDILTRVTNIGPHRDNFIFYLKDMQVDSFASRGELRSIILALKLSESNVLEEETKEIPILLLDDVFSELDETRRRFLVKSFERQQTIVTTTDLDHIEEKARKEALIYEIKNQEALTVG